MTEAAPPLGTALPVPVPPYGQTTLAEVVPAVAAALGHPVAAGELTAGERADGHDPTRTPPLSLPAVERVCLLLVDGLGLRLLEEHADLAPTLMGSDVQRRSVMTGFPSTTPASLAMLGTGLAPGQHGLVGYRVFEEGLPVDPAGVLNLLQWHESLDPMAYQPRPTMFERLEAVGVDVVTVGPRAFRGTGLTLAALRGGRHLGADSLGELVAQSAAAAGDRRSFVYSYLSDLDGTGHRMGVDSEAWREQLGFVDRLVARLRQSLPPGTLLLVTGDHGMVDVPMDRRFDLAAHPELWPGVAATAGEPRAFTLRLEAGAEAADVCERWQAALGPDFLVLATAEAAPLYGPMSPAAVTRAGDVLVLSLAEDVALIDSRHKATTAGWLHGMHGSVTDAERIVPLAQVLT